MSKKIDALVQQASALVREVEVIAALSESEGRSHTAVEVARMEAITEAGGLLDSLNSKIAHEQKVAAICAKLEIEHNAKVGSHDTVRFQKQKPGIFDNHEQAYNAGMFFASELFGNRRATKYCEQNGIISNAMTEGNDLRGGSLVPEPLERKIVELREQFGTFRREAQVVSMSSESYILPKNVGELTSYYVSENAEITQSDMSLAQIRLTARKLATLTTVSSELDEDSLISVAEMLTRSIAYSFALKEDQAGFLGDGSASYGGIMGLSNALQAGCQVTATGRTTFGALTLADFEACIGRAKMWAGSSPKWYISQAGWAHSMQRLLDAAGGNSLVSLAMGAEKTFLGFPVVINQCLPSALTDTTGTLACFFGDLSQGVLFGSRRGVSVQVDPSRYFSQDALAVRATERFDINVHDRGDASNAGGIVDLIFG